MRPGTGSIFAWPRACRIRRALRQPLCVPEILGLGLLLVASGAAPADNALIYRLEPGDRLVYQRREIVTPLDGSGPARQTTGQVQIWCFQQDAQTALVLLDLMPAPDEPGVPSSAVVVYVGKTGRRQLPAEIPTRLAPLDPALDLLPLLPLTARSAARWTTPPDPFGRRWSCVARGADAAHHGHQRIDFVVEEPPGFQELLERSRRGVFWFDAAAGCVTRLETEAVDRRQNTRTQVVAVFDQKLHHPPRWAARRVDETVRFLRALRCEDRLLHEIITRPAEVPRTRKKLDQLWAAFKSDVDGRAGSPFARLAEDRRISLRGMADSFPARAALGGRWLNEPARPWSLQDLDGHTLTSETARREVLIECFWSAETIWGLRVLDSMRRLQAERTIPPVRVLCYNMDEDWPRARQAIQRCGRRLTHVFGEPLRDVERLPELPVVRVVDADGVVRGLWIGWDPDFAAARELAVKLADPNRQ